MKINVYTIEFNFPRWLKRALVYGVLPAGLLLGVGAVVRAATVPTLVSFSNGDTLSATNINSNFNALRDTINTLTIAPTQITAGALPANVTVANATAATSATNCTSCTSATSATSAASCTTCSAASGTLATQISALQAKTTSLSLKVATASQDMAAGGWTQVGVSCASVGGLLVAGGCRNGMSWDTQLWESFMGGAGNSTYYCSFYNGSTATRTGTVFAYCLTAN